MTAFDLKFAWAMALVILLARVSGAALFGQEADRYTLHLNNSSGYDLYHIYVSSSDSGFWGRDLLGDDVLPAPGSIDIINIAAGEYDLKLVDEDGDSCVRIKVKFFQDRAINITRDWLIGCEFHNPGR